jgi:hypothetical protein
MLSNPPEGEWLTWRRTYDDMGFSPLRQITRDNVKNLRVAWTLTLPAGPNEATPLVHDGVIFVHSYNDNVQALDAATGNELWHYSRRLPEGTRASTKRNMALYGNKLFFGTSDLHVVALDSKTGNVVWDRAVAKTDERWNLTGGPLVAKGKVMQGIGGQGRGGAYITALDSETGVEAWRFYTVARPDEPGGNTWNGLALEDRSGGSVWTAGSYDPELNLAFFGPGPTYDTAPLRNPVNRPGITNDALYTMRPSRSTRTRASWSGTTSTCRTINGTWIGRSNASSFACLQLAARQESSWLPRASLAFTMLSKQTPENMCSPSIWVFRTSLPQSILKRERRRLMPNSFPAAASRSLFARMRSAGGTGYLAPTIRPRKSSTFRQSRHA